MSGLKVPEMPLEEGYARDRATKLAWAATYILMDNQ